MQQDSLQSQQDAQTSAEAWKELRSGEKEGVTDMWVKVMVRIKLKQEFKIARPQETHILTLNPQTLSFPDCVLSL